MVDEEYREEYEKAFHNAFYQMAYKVEKLFADYQEILAKKKTKKEKAKDNALGKGGDPSYSSSSESYSTPSNPKKQPEKTNFDIPDLKLNMKFDFPTYNGELNEKNLED